MRTILSLLTISSLCVLTAVSSAQVKFSILNKTPLDRAVDFQQKQLASYFEQMNKENTGLIRLVEGGVYNVNIRHAQNVTPDKWRPEFHKDTVDVWIIREGSGTVVTGGEMVDDKLVGGVERSIGVGDVIFVPAGIYHGVKETRSITWLNVRFPEVRSGASSAPSGE